MKDICYMAGLSPESLMKHCREVFDGSWCDARPGSCVLRRQTARVFVREGCRVTAATGSRIDLYGGALFVLGDFLLMPRTRIEMYYTGMLVLGGGYLGYGSFLSCQEKLWIADADIGPMCYVSDNDGHKIRRADGTDVLMRSPTILHEHVFIGPGSSVLKGSEIGAGTVIGPKSLVRGTLPPECYAEGMPAVPVEHGITWERPPMDIREML